jgi:hypothetical protein
MQILMVVDINIDFLPGRSRAAWGIDTKVSKASAAAVFWVEFSVAFE